MRQGFSLVELSIVLVILGLLTGGILAGQSLIRAAELRSVSTDIQKYHAAVFSFRDKYFAMPGDMRNAIDFWGAAHATPATCLTTAGTGTQTCNGNGDGRITNGGAASARGETFMFWEHLANAGLIEGDYTGFSGNSVTYPGRHVVPGVNSPVSKMSNVGFYYEYNSGGQRHLFMVGEQQNSPTWYPFLIPEEAWNIDKKLDDGLPDSGSLTVSLGYTNCASSTAYVLTYTGKACNLYVLKSL